VTTTFIRSGRALHRNAGPDVVAMLPGQGELHVLSGPAAVIWEILVDGARIDDVTGEVARLYRRPPAEVGPSVEECVRTLADRGLVEERS
jgi:Coenzyme PQQ synthesis protein D (PqqD)